MKKWDLEEGVTYHNGLTGNRSYSSRKIVNLGNKNGVDYVDYIQVAGRFKGEKAFLKLESFASWAKGIVEEE